MGRSAYRVVALVPNLMDRGPVEAAVRSAGATLEFAATPELLSEAVAAGARLAVVDLAVPGVMAVVATLDAVTVGFGSHVDRAMLDRARDGGCDEVLPRSALARRLARIIRGRVDGGPGGGKTGGEGGGNAADDHPGRPGGYPSESWP